MTPEEYAAQVGGFVGADGTVYIPGSMGSGSMVVARKPTASGSGYYQAISNKSDPAYQKATAYRWLDRFFDPEGFKTESNEKFAKNNKPLEYVMNAWSAAGGDMAELANLINTRSNGNINVTPEWLQQASAARVEGYEGDLPDNVAGLESFYDKNAIEQFRQGPTTPSGRGQSMFINPATGQPVTRPSTPTVAPTTTTPTTTSTTTAPVTTPVTTTPTLLTSQPMVGSPDVAASGPAAGPGSYGGMMTPWAAKGFSYSGFGGGGGGQGSGMPRRRGLFYR